jgi:hypothetical protein
MIPIITDTYIWTSSFFRINYRLMRQKIRFRGPKNSWIPTANRSREPGSTQFFIFWPLYCFLFFDWRLLITPLISSNISIQMSLKQRRILTLLYLLSVTIFQLTAYLVINKHAAVMCICTHFCKSASNLDGLWVRILPRRDVLDTALCDKCLSVICDRPVVFSGFLPQ